MQGQHTVSFPNATHALTGLPRMSGQCWRVGLLENGADFNSKYSATAPTSRSKMVKGTSGHGGKKQGNMVRTARG
jgi:hypothetical protein